MDGKFLNWKMEYSILAIISSFVVLSNQFSMPEMTSSSTTKYTEYYEQGNTTKCEKLKGLSSGQRKHCLLYEDHMGIVSKGIKNSLQECKWQFKNQKWNCTSMDKTETFFGPTFPIGSKEAAFTQAIVSAGVVHSISRSCKDGNLMTCGCSKSGRPNGLRTDWLWGGCGDNMEYGYRFSQGLMDVKERENRGQKRPKEKGRSLMNLHNNEAGRRAVLKTSKVTCKCHGVSGSCSLITCWQQLPTFRDIGDYIKERYDKAPQVKLKGKGRLQLKEIGKNKPSVNDLVYLAQSPDYCKKDTKLATLGTQGRICNKTSEKSDGCNSMCCGRGYDTKKVVTKEKCNCIFHWCCYVQCNNCIKLSDQHTCK